MGPWAGLSWAPSVCRLTVARGLEGSASGGQLLLLLVGNTGVRATHSPAGCPELGHVVAGQGSKNESRRQQGLLELRSRSGTMLLPSCSTG